jgi:hypothetical protein
MVIAFNGPGVPLQGVPKSRALGLDGAISTL